MNSKCQSRAGRPEKVHGLKGNKADKTKLSRIVENPAENLGRAPDSWSLKNEWTLIYKEYFGTKMTR